MTKNKGGNPPFEATQEMRDTVEFMAAAGIKHETIAKIVTKTMVKCSYATLRKHFKDELALGMDMANATIAQGLYQKAAAGDLGAICFWLKTRAGWRETSVIEMPNNLPPPTIAISFASGGPGFRSPEQPFGDEDDVPGATASH